jgi:diguanylate cyclase (GGDEF)-like protein
MTADNVTGLDYVLQSYEDADVITFDLIRGWERLLCPEDRLRLYNRIMFDCLIRGTPDRLKKGLPGYLRGQAMNAVDEVERRAMTDGLTGLANIEGFRKGLEQSLARAEREHYRASGKSVAVVFIDVNKFKEEANDKYGHQFGDDVLRYVGAALDKVVRLTDLKARLMGDEFAVILDPLKEDDSQETLHRLAVQTNDYMRREIALHHFGKTADISLSLGMSMFGRDATDPDELLDHADKAMYHAKRHPVHTDDGVLLHYHLYDPSMTYVPKEMRQGRR